MKKMKAVVYGLGNFYREFGEQINELYEVVAKTDRDINAMEGMLSIGEALSLPYDIIIIMIKNIKACFDVINNLMSNYSVPADKMMLGVNLSAQNAWDRLDINANGNIVFNKNNISIITKNLDEFNNIKGIFCADCYNYFLNDTVGEVVIDIGMNIGGASLYFMNRHNVAKVYGFEPFTDTFAEAEENFKLNGIDDRERIECFPYGISDVNECRKVTYNKNMTCGQSTNVEINAKARKNYYEWELICNNDDKAIEVEVRDIKEVLQKIYEAHRNENIVLKLDCEGEEYRIMNRLDEEHLFDRIKVIMLEYHYEGEKKLIEILKKNQYSYWVFKHEGLEGWGEIYALKK